MSYALGRAGLWLGRTELQIKAASPVGLVLDHRPAVAVMTFQGLLQLAQL